MTSLVASVVDFETRLAGKYKKLLSSEDSRYGLRVSFVLNLLPGYYLEA
jgi:hypothetical protein